MNEEERRIAIESLYDTFTVTIGAVKFKFKKELPVGKIWEVKNQFIKRIKEKADLEEDKEVKELTIDEKLENEKQNMKSICFILSILSLDGFTPDEFLAMHQSVVDKLMQEIKPYVFPNLKENTEKKKSMIPMNPNPSII